MNPGNPEIDDNPQTNPSGRAPLSEKDFIKNGWSFLSLPFWVWFFLAAVGILLFLGTGDWYSSFMQKVKKRDPFLEVTNREFSVFLWQFPGFMRVNATQKNGYLPGFLTDNVNFEISKSEDFVSAPPDLIFLYHTWNRLVAKDLFTRPISPGEFDDFLAQVPEWKPGNWVNAPRAYATMVDTKEYLTKENLQSLPESVLPLNVRSSFIGWKNYFVEGGKINEISPTFHEIKAFLEKYPHYARNYWRNIQEIHHQKIAGVEYLDGFVSGTYIPDAKVPKEQLSSFLKVAYFNATNNP